LEVFFYFPPFSFIFLIFILQFSFSLIILQHIRIGGCSLGRFIYLGQVPGNRAVVRSKKSLLFLFPLHVASAPAFCFFSCGVLHFFCYFTGVNIWLYCYSQVHNTLVYFLREHTIDPIFLQLHPNFYHIQTLGKPLYTRARKVLV